MVKREQSLRTAERRAEIPLAPHGRRATMSTRKAPPTSAAEKVFVARTFIGCQVPSKTTGRCCPIDAVDDRSDRASRVRKLAKHRAASLARGRLTADSSLHAPPRPAGDPGRRVGELALLARSGVVDRLSTGARVVLRSTSLVKRICLTVGSNPGAVMRTVCSFSSRGARAAYGLARGAPSSMVITACAGDARSDTETVAGEASARATSLFALLESNATSEGWRVARTKTVAATTSVVTTMPAAITPPRPRFQRGERKGGCAGVVFGRNTRQRVVFEHAFARRRSRHARNDGDARDRGLVETHRAELTARRGTEPRELLLDDALNLGALVREEFGHRRSELPARIRLARFGEVCLDVCLHFRHRGVAVARDRSERPSADEVDGIGNRRHRFLRRCSVIAGNEIAGRSPRR